MRLRTCTRLAAVCLGASFISGCWGNEVTPFPPGLEPLEAENKAPPPDPEPGDPYPEKFIAVGGTSVLGYDWAHEHGYIHAPIAKVWEAMRQPEVTRDHDLSDWSVRDVETGDPKISSYILHYTVHDLLTVEFEVTWRHGIIGEGEETFLASRYQKTYGTPFIERLEGSVVVRRVDDQTSELFFQEHLSATNSGEHEIELYFADYIHHLLAAVHGAP